MDQGDLQYATFITERLDNAQTKCLEIQREAYSVGKGPAVLAHHYKELEVPADEGDLQYVAVR
jgi:hypothetical protein